MKFNINGYSQKRLIENGLDVVDSLVLRAIADMYVSSSKKITYKIIGSDKFMWCSYGYLLKQIPIVGAKRTLIRKIDKLIEKEILKKEVIVHQKGVQGKFLYLAFDKKYSTLTEYEPSDKMSSDQGDQVTNCHQPSDKLSSDQVTNCHIKDYTNNNYSIKHNYYTNESNLDPGKNDEPKKEVVANFENSGAYLQSIKMILGNHKINYKTLARLGKTLERIKEVVKFAENNDKNDGWIFAAIRDEYTLVEKPKTITKKHKVFDMSEKGWHFETYEVPCK